jgi:hypothetical protein
MVDAEGRLRPELGGEIEFFETFAQPPKANGDLGGQNGKCE